MIHGDRCNVCTALSWWAKEHTSATAGIKTMTILNTHMCVCVHVCVYDVTLYPSYIYVSAFIYF